jgi:hypothetical protein
MSINTQLQQLLDETGLGSKLSLQDLQALSGVSVKERIALFNELAENAKASATNRKKRDDIVREWAQKVVEKHRAMLESTEPVEKQVIVVQTEPQNTIVEQSHVITLDNEQILYRLDELSNVKTRIAAVEERRKRKNIFTTERNQLVAELSVLRAKEYTLRDSEFYNTVYEKKNSPFLRNLGITRSSTLARAISSPTSDVRVNLIKHIHDNNVVLQFEIDSAESINDVVVKLPEHSKIKVKATVPAQLADGTDSIFIVIERPHESLITADFESLVLTYMNSNFVQQSVNLDGFSLNVGDYVTNVDNSISAWDSLGSENESITYAYLPSQKNDIVDVLEAVSEIGNLKPKEHYAEKADFFGVYETFDFIGTYNSEPISVQVQVTRSTSEIMSKITVRSKNQVFRAEFADEIRLAVQDKLYLQFNRKKVFLRNLFGKKILDVACGAHHILFLVGM